MTMGLWFELPVSGSAPAALQTRLKDAKGGPHITIAHLGDLELDGEAHAKDLQAVAAEMILQEMRREFLCAAPYTLDVTGSGRFLVGVRDYPVDVLLVRGKQLGLLYDVL
jgi:hypothetical protein